MGGRCRGVAAVDDGAPGRGVERATDDDRRAADRLGRERRSQRTRARSAGADPARRQQQADRARVRAQPAHGEAPRRQHPRQARSPFARAGRRLVPGQRVGVIGGMQMLSPFDSSLLLYAGIALAIVGVIAFVAALVALLRLRPLRFVARTLIAALLFCAGALCLAVSFGMQGYRALVDE